MKENYEDWNDEFLHLEFHDQRLKKRFFKIMNAISSTPDQSILSASGSRISAKAAYRFFANEEVSYKELLESISNATLKNFSKYNLK